MNDDRTTDSEIDIGAFVRRCIVRWKLATAIAAGLTVLVAAGSLLLTNKYKCSTKLVFLRTGSALSGSLGTLASLAGVDAGAKGNDPSMYFDDLVESSGMGQAILGRPWRASKVVDDTSKPFYLSEFWGDVPDTTDAQWREKQQERLLRRLRTSGCIETEQDKKSGVITLTTNFEDPRLAFDVNRFIVETINDMVVQRSIAKASENKKFVEGRLEQVRIDLAAAEEALKSFRDSNRVRTDPELQLRESRLQRNLQITQEVYLQLVKQQEMAEIDEAKDLPVLDLIDQALMPVEKSWPKRRLLAMAACVVGGFLGLLCAGAWDFYAEDRRGFWRRLASITKQERAE